MDTPRVNGQKKTDSPPKNAKPQTPPLEQQKKDLSAAIAAQEAANTEIGEPIKTEPENITTIPPELLDSIRSYSDPSGFKNLRQTAKFDHLSKDELSNLIIEYYQRIITPCIEQGNLSTTHLKEILAHTPRTEATLTNSLLEAVNVSRQFSSAALNYSMLWLVNYPGLKTGVFFNHDKDIETH